MADALNFDKAKQAWTLPWDQDWVTAVNFLGPTRRLVAGNNRGQLLVWELPEKPGGAAPLPLRRLDGHTNCITRLLSTADGRWLISSSYDHTIRYWDTQAPAKGKERLELNARTRAERRRRSSRRVPAAVEATVEVQQAARVLAGHKEWVTSLALSKDEKLLLSGDDAGQVAVWDRPAARELRRWKVKGWVYAASLSPDNKQAAVSERVPLVFDSGQHAGLRLWDVNTGQPRHDLGKTFKGMYLSAAAYSPDGKVLAVGRGGEVYGPNGKVFFVDPSSGKKVRELSPGHLYGVTDLVFHPAGKHLASAGRDTMVRIWDVGSGKLVKALGKSRGGQFKDWIHAVAFSADGRWLAAADMVGAVQVWSLAG